MRWRQELEKMKHAEKAAESVENSEDELPLGERPRKEELRRDLRLLTVGWLFGSVFWSTIGGTPLTNFAKSFSATPFQFGILSALPFIASLASLPAALLTEATGQRKKIFIWGAYFQRGMFFPAVLLPLWMLWANGGRIPASAIWVFLGLIFLMFSCGAAANPGATSWLADIVPERSRGKFFGRRRALAIPAGVAAAWVAGWAQDQFAPNLGLPWVCAIIFMAAALIGLMEIRTYERIPDIPYKPVSGRELLKTWREPLRNKEFLWFGGFVATLFFAITFMGQFAMLYVMNQLSASKSVNATTQMMLLVVPSLGQMVVFSSVGRACDRMGKKPLLVLAGLGLAPVAVGWCFVTPNTIWLGYILGVMGAISWLGIEVANLNLVLEFSGSAENGNGGGGSGFTAVNSVITNVAGCLGGLAAGALAQWLKNIDFAWHTGFKTFTYFEVLFVLSGLMRFLAVVVFLPHIHEQGAKPTREALRFMTASVFDNLYNAVKMPLNALGFSKRETYVEPRKK
jgi:MFS family permease